MKRRLLLLSLALAAVCSGQALAQSPIILKFSHVVANDTPKGKAAERFKELAEKYTKGRVKVELYPNSNLYKAKE
ncbi:MAG: DctP family transporter solute-binding subunit [Paucimonas sp.]|nr:DctP family transporter solute-binding subunit [Paucimonas sp.]